MNNFIDCVYNGNNFIIYRNFITEIVLKDLPKRLIYMCQVLIIKGNDNNFYLYKDKFGYEISVEEVFERINNNKDNFYIINKKEYIELSKEYEKNSNIFINNPYILLDLSNEKNSNISMKNPYEHFLDLGNEKENLKIYSARSDLNNPQLEDQYGEIFGIIIAENEEEAKKIYDDIDWQKIYDDVIYKENLSEIEFKKGFHLIGSFFE